MYQKHPEHSGVLFNYNCVTLCLTLCNSVLLITSPPSCFRIDSVLLKPYFIRKKPNENRIKTERTQTLTKGKDEASDDGLCNFNLFLPTCASPASPGQHQNPDLTSLFNKLTKFLPKLLTLYQLNSSTFFYTYCLLHLFLVILWGLECKNWC